MDRLDSGAERRYWIPEQGTEGNIDDIQEDLGLMETEVKIALPVSHNALTIIEEYVR